MRVGRYIAAVLVASPAVTMVITSCLPAAHPSPRADRPYKLDAGRYSVREATHVWHDSVRGRDIPVRVYLPEEEGGPFPTIVFSHGLGTSRDHYTYLGRHWASHGYVAVHLSHPGSDSSLFATSDNILEAVLAVVEDPENRCERPRDVSFVLDKLGTQPGIRDSVDMERVGVAGHSFGAFTALATIGMHFDLPEQPGEPFADPRVRAVVAMSPQGPGVWGLREDSWDEIYAPCMFMMGTLDVDGILVFDASQRRGAFECSDGRDQYLVTLQGATHVAFDESSR